VPTLRYRAGQPAKSWRSVEYARRTRDALIATLGGRCVRCHGRCMLQFDHKQPIGWDPSRLSWSSRMARYKRDADEGLLQLLCIRCHGKKSAAEVGTLFDDPF